MLRCFDLEVLLFVLPDICNGIAIAQSIELLALIRDIKRRTVID